MTNNLVSEALSIHWHGITQDHNPWYDGVAFINQCPISPSETFTYHFVAKPAGIHWYHSHLNAQRMNGLFGMLIVHERAPKDVPYSNVMIGDWFGIDALSMQVSAVLSGDIFSPTNMRGYSIDGSDTAAITFSSVLINGRGRHQENKRLPLDEIKVVKNKKHGFRVVNAGTDFALEISIDQHTLTVDGTEAGNIEEIDNIDSIILGVGERIEFEINADQDPSVNYWIRAKTLRWGRYGGSANAPPVPDNVVEEGLAILAYTKVTEDPKTLAKACTQEDKCRVFSCPFCGFGSENNRTCINLNDAHSTESKEVLNKQYGLQEANSDEIERYFLNWGFNGGAASVNSMSFVMPEIPFYIKGFDKKCRIFSIHTQQTFVHAQWKEIEPFFK